MTVRNTLRILGVSLALVALLVFSTVLVSGWHHHASVSVSSVLGLLAWMGVPVETAAILVSYINKLRLENDDGVAATLALAFASCPASQYGSTRIRIPAPGTADNDHNPSRIAPRNLFDMSLGDDNLLRSKDDYRWSLRLTVINLTHKVALYNFLSTFSGTHFVTPRAYTAELGFHF
jgi:hypothetical protein